MKVSTRFRWSKWALASAIAAALYCTLCLYGSVMGDPNPGMSPAEKARDAYTKNMSRVYFKTAWLVVFGVAIYMRWQKYLWKTEREKPQQASIR